LGKPVLAIDAASFFAIKSKKDIAESATFYVPARQCAKLVLCFAL